MRSLIFGALLFNKATVSPDPLGTALAGAALASAPRVGGEAKVCMMSVGTPMAAFTPLKSRLREDLWRAEIGGSRRLAAVR